MTNRNVFSLLFVFLFFGCAHVTRSATHSKAECYDLLKQIVAVQDYRNDLSTKMHETTVSYKHDEISLEDFRKHREEWLVKENNLHHQVNEMYNMAYGTRCLE